MTDQEKPAQVPIHEALINVMRDLQAIGKNDKNTQQNYAFRGIDATVNAVGPIMRRHGVLPLPQGADASYRDVRTSNDKPSREVTVKARYRLIGPMGDFLDVEAPGEAMDFGDKGTPKAMSVALRTLLLQMFIIPTGETDPDSQSYQRAAEPRPSASRPASTSTPRAQPQAPASPPDERSQALQRVLTAAAARNLSNTDMGDEFALWASDVPGANTAPKSADTDQLNRFAAYLEKLTEDAAAIERAREKNAKLQPADS